MMKYIGMPIIINICLLMAGIAGFSVTSLAVKIYCYQCKNVFDKQISGEGIKNKEFCGRCKAKQEKSTDDNPKTTPKRTRKALTFSNDSETNTAEINIAKPTAGDTPANEKDILSVQPTQLPEADTPSTSDIGDNAINSNDTTVTEKHLLHGILPASTDVNTLLAQSMQLLGAAEKTVDPSYNREIALIYAMHDNSDLTLLFNKAALITSDEKKLVPGWDASFTTDTVSVIPVTDIFPEFFTTYALSKTKDERQLLLLEKQTEYTIRHAVEKVKKCARNSNKALHMFVKEKSSADATITHYTLIINKDDNRKTVVHFFDPKTFIYYKISAENLSDFISICKKWAGKTNHIFEIYNATPQAKCFQLPKNNEATELTHEKLKSMIKSLCGKQAVQHLNSKRAEYGQILNDIRHTSPLLKKKIEVSFSEWYQETIHTDTKKSFTITLSSTEFPGDNYTILITPLNKSTCGLYLLERNAIEQEPHQQYIMFPANKINIIAKQLMFLFNNIEVHEIIQ